MKNIWRENDDTYKLAPITEQVIEKAEEQLQIKLPKSYIDLLYVQNGGAINEDAYPTDVPTNWADDHIKVDHILGIGEEEGILQSEYFIQEWGLPQNIVLISGDGHSWVAFDYRKTKEEPPIIYVEEGASQIVELASNFETFLEKLYIEEIEDDYIVEEDKKSWTQEELKKAFATTDEQEVTIALNYLYMNPTGNEQFIEQQLLLLLQSPLLEMKQMAANFANHFNEVGVLTSQGVEEMVSILRKDADIDYYIEMFFSENEKN